MKKSLALGIALATFSTVAMAETPAPTTAAPAQAGGMPAMGGQMKDRMKSHMEKVWKEMDANGDNSISKDESVAFGNKKFDERDSNHDSKVTREEWDSFRDARMEEMKAKMGAEHGKMPMDGKPAVPPAPANPKK